MPHTPSGRRPPEGYVPPPPPKHRHVGVDEPPPEAPHNPPAEPDDLDDEDRGFVPTPPPLPEPEEHG
jgi:hypothetical protein